MLITVLSQTEGEGKDREDGVKSFESPDSYVKELDLLAFVSCRLPLVFPHLCSRLNVVSTHEKLDLLYFKFLLGVNELDLRGNIPSSVA